MTQKSDFKAGFVTIMGKPNVGKSTLMNALIGESLSITTPKAQTTRHRIFGIDTTDDYQIVYSDTPGTLDPHYKLQNQMMKYVHASLDDADIILYVVELGNKNDEDEWIKLAQRTKVPMLFLINKIDTAKGSQVVDKVQYWKEQIEGIDPLPVSATDGLNLAELKEKIMELLPLHPAYFPGDTLTDRSERFFTSEMIREKIFLNYKQEIPYSSEVVVTDFKEDETIIRIRAEIYVERETQKGIIIGKKAEAIKKLGMDARKSLEEFFQKQIHLETYVKVEKDWRSKDVKLKRFGY
ncbi:MAG: GTPase Era [Bacteroidota bacterium]